MHKLSCLLHLFRPLTEADMIPVPKHHEATSKPVVNEDADTIKVLANSSSYFKIIFRNRIINYLYTYTGKNEKEKER